MRVLLGIWVQAEDRRDSSGRVLERFPDAVVANRREVETGIRLAGAHPRIVLGLCVGNETQVFWSDHRCPPAVLIGYLREVRGRTGVPVSTADDFNFWNKPASDPVASECDFIVVHAHPLWNGTQLEDALDWTRARLADVQAKHPGEPLVLGETGCGCSPPALEDLLSRHARRTVLPRVRPAAPVEIDPPPEWRDWAASTLARARGRHCTVRYLARRAAVVSPDRWTAVSSPPLVRVELAGEPPVALLAVWGQPRLRPWLSELLAPAPARRWRPDPGLELPVLMGSGTAGVLLHELIGHLVESDLVLSGDSPLAALCGAAVTAVSIAGGEVVVDRLDVDEEKGVL